LWSGGLARGGELLGDDRVRHDQKSKQKNRKQELQIESNFAAKERKELKEKMPPESQDRKIDDRNMPMNRSPIFLSSMFLSFSAMLRRVCFLAQIFAANHVVHTGKPGQEN